MEWVYLIIAGFCEVIWAYYLDASYGFSKLVPSIMAIIFIGISFFILEKAMKKLGVGVAYAAFTGLGTAGTAIMGMIFLGESVSFLKIVALIILLTGILGLKLSEGTDKT
ncbi:DMT family transporter [Carnobacterium gallinarum]|uniref:DMT family transporter n=1 Tax=Carnobacterium gallinarum TaxID=2749 RepID=UPI0005508802|nr:multidrug efflux SMR transporter [Carnobacterium gallinarum]